MLEKAKARLNRTVAALMQRGFYKTFAEQLQTQGYTVRSLTLLSSEQLTRLGCSDEQIKNILTNSRPPIPFEALARVLWKNRFTCCVCRDPSKAVILHHIVSWSVSRDHRDANLAVLCLEHHAKAHRKGDLEQNLSVAQLREFKGRWELAVESLDSRAILEASRTNDHHWWWFNHFRILTMAAALGIELKLNPHLISARAYGRIDNNGLLRHNVSARNYLYEGGDGIILYDYMKWIVDKILERSAIFNISNDLDVGFLSRIVRPGDMILVEGKHYFREVSKVQKGPGQTREVRREVGRVRISFTIDRWEAVSNSSWGMWLSGAKAASSILRVVNIVREKGSLHLQCTGLALGALLTGLTHRSYVHGGWPMRSDIDDDEDWLEGFDQ